VVKEMKNRIVWLAGISLIGIMLLGMLLAIPAITNADNSQPMISPADFIKAYQQALTGPLNKATSEVKDPELAKFSQNLVKSYNLEKVGSGDTGKTELSDLVPDIAKIQKTALNTTLKEAGKQLKDKDLSEFYSRFIANCGVDK
jgi:hypothetical protein